MQVAINGSIIPEEKAYIHLKDRGFLLGDGLFETCKVQNGHIEFFEEHYKRLADSANAIFIPFNFSADEVKKICANLIKKNELTKKTASIRMTLTRGVGLRGIHFPEKPNPTFVITAETYDTPKPNHSVRAMITSIKRNPASAITKFKTLNYLEPILAKQEARENGFDEGIMLNTDGYIAECSVANIFIIKNNNIITPAIESGILPGITRNHVISTCRKNGYAVFEKLLSVNEVLDADEVFQTNSLMGVQIISHVNKKNYKSDIVLKIIELISDRVTD